jgi:anti-sigma B factor antagonist
VIIRLLDRVKGDATVQDGGSDADVVTTQIASPEAAPPVVIPAQPATPAPVITPAQLELSTCTGPNGYQVVSVAGELDIATAEQAYSFITEVIDGPIKGFKETTGFTGTAPVTVDLSGVTFCDASGLGALARLARYARAAGRQLRLTSARPSVMKIIRITGLDRVFPELHPPVHAFSALAAEPGPQPGPGSSVRGDVEDVGDSR